LREGKMSINVRIGTRDDIKALVEVYRSDVQEWYHFTSKGRGNKASYDELSTLERVMHGGPWMDPKALTKYWDDIEKLGITLVAEIQGKVVGHLDVIFSNELPLGHFLYLDVLEVHNDYRRKGVATALIKSAEELAKEKGASFMLVEPEKYEGPSGLTYRSCGFTRAFEAYNLEMPIETETIPNDVCLISIPQNMKAPIETHEMVCGWYNISSKTWNYGVNPDLDHLRFFSCHELALSALINDEAFFFHLQQDRCDHSVGSLVLWSPASSIDSTMIKTIFKTVKASASWLGIKKLGTKTLEKYVSLLEEMSWKKTSQVEPYLTKVLSK
jgi:GNAT superfamily N-acetyltransferase